MSKELVVDIHLKAGNFRRQVNLRAASGVNAVVGPSGCGKTSTLNCIAGLLKPISGRISFGERVWFDSEANIDVSPQIRKTGYVFQRAALFPHLSVAENVVFGLYDRPPKEKEQQLQILSKLFGLQELLARKPAQLSGGQAQKVALARALAPDPQLLLLDEPINALDRCAREEVSEKLRTIQQQRDLTIVLVTHFLEEPGTHADSVIDIGQDL